MAFEIFSTIDAKFEDLYIALREKEGRIYTAEECIELPYLSSRSKHFNEWKMRAETMERFLGYLEKRGQKKQLLDIGCGNGWFSHRCSQKIKTVVGVDLNVTELKIAASTFKNEGLSFAYWDVYDKNPFIFPFDYIVLNAVIQYFEDFSALIERLKGFLSPNGEIHILDSPFYDKSTVEEARRRSKDYYQKMGFSELSSFYHHHLKSNVEHFEELYRPVQNKWKRKFFRNASPFSWYRYRLT
tara:strand:+ start:134 stop:859 length:726 start_codon:yes stop_codon:yes gene_type:complete